jgi:heat shock protein beta
LWRFTWFFWFFHFFSVFTFSRLVVVCIADEAAPVPPAGLNMDEVKGLASEKKEYQSDVKKVMDMIIHSIYSNVEVFLRELISNGSDALDKIRIIGLTNRDAVQHDELSVKIRADEEKRELHIIDTGVGMTKDELVENLGTIAKSGTKEFLKKAKESDAQQLIGQFGVGFYSAFLVADSVTVISKSYKETQQHVWHSDAAQDYIVAEDPRGDTLKHGTHIILHFKEANMDLLKEDTLKGLIEKYSEFISFPIYLWTKRTESEEVPLTEEELENQRLEAEKAAEKADDEEIKTEGEDEKKAEEKKELPTTKTVEKEVQEWKHINLKQPIWTRPKSQVTQEEYNEFYKHIAKDWQDPIAHEHFSAEGDVNFKALVYIPQKPSQDYWQGANENAGLKLFVKRVYITDNWKNILPRYLGFIRGVVDAEEVDLNVSREVLQQSKTLNAIKSKIVRKTIGMIQYLAQNETEWAPFWKNYGKVLKYGIMEDNANKERLSKLLQFDSTTGNQTTFQQYVDRYIEGQEEIYFLAGESLETVKDSPLLEKLEARGLEVLLLVDPIDEYVFTTLTKFDGKHKLTNVAREGLKLPGESEENKEQKEKDAKETEEEWKDTTEWLKEQLKDKVRKVIVSDRLTKSPAALVAGSYGLTANMERIVKSQALGDQDPSLQYQPKPVLEVNVHHPVLMSLRGLIAADSKDATALDTASILFESSAIASGYGISNPQQFAQRMTRMLARSMGDVPPPPPKKAAEPVQEQAEAETAKEEL